MNTASCSLAVKGGEGEEMGEGVDGVSGSKWQAGESRWRLAQGEAAGRERELADERCRLRLLISFDGLED